MNIYTEILDPYLSQKSWFYNPGLKTKTKAKLKLLNHLLN